MGHPRCLEIMSVVLYDERIVEALLDNDGLMWVLAIYPRSSGLTPSQRLVRGKLTKDDDFHWLCCPLKILSC